MHQLRFGFSNGKEDPGSRSRVPFPGHPLVAARDASGPRRARRRGICSTEGHPAAGREGRRRCARMVRTVFRRGGGAAARCRPGGGPGGRADGRTGRADAFRGTRTRAGSSGGGPPVCRLRGRRQEHSELSRLHLSAMSGPPGRYLYNLRWTEGDGLSGVPGAEVRARQASERTVRAMQRGRHREEVVFGSAAKGPLRERRSDDRSLFCLQRIGASDPIRTHPL